MKGDNVYKPKSARFLKWKRTQPVNTLEHEITKLRWSS